MNWTNEAAVKRVMDALQEGKIGLKTLSAAEHLLKHGNAAGREIARQVLSQKK